MSHMFIHKNFENLEKIASENSNNYISAKPFSSIMFDNFFEADLLNKILEDFLKILIKLAMSIIIKLKKN